MISLIKNITPSEIISYFSKGHERTVRAKKNIAYSILLKGINIATGLLIVPLILIYIDQTRYGIWLTISSLIMWFNFIDVGLGHGLRNKLSETLVFKNYQLSKKYISTSYAIISIIISSFLIIFLIINPYIDWNIILNTDSFSNNELGFLILIVFGFFSIRLLLQLIFSILYAIQKPAMIDLIRTIGKVLNLVVIYILLRTTEGSLLNLGLSYSIIPVIILIIFTIILYSKSLKQLKPNLNYVDFSLSKDLLTLGGKFFIIQISIVILYATDNMIIVHLYSPSEVIPYQIAHKYFGLILIASTIVLSPFWSAITEAYSKGELFWIKKSITKLTHLWIVACCVLASMLILSGKIYTLWLGDKVTIPFALSLSWSFFIAIQLLTNIFMTVINGTGKIKFQMIITIIGAIFNIPLSIFLAKYCNMGVIGVITATIIYQLICLLLVFIQYKKIVSENLHGIFDK